jgi:Tol biopolymer transport system component
MFTGSKTARAASKEVNMEVFEKRGGLSKYQTTVSTRGRNMAVLLAALCLPLMLQDARGQATKPRIVRASQDSEGSGANGLSNYTNVSPEGRYVAFRSLATNLVENDTNGVADIYIFDRMTGKVTRESLDAAGNELNGDSLIPSLSDGGHWIAFDSLATNAVPDDTNGYRDVFVRDRETGTVTRVSVDSSGHDANGLSQRGKISADGRYVYFNSEASNLVPEDNNGVVDVFVHDRLTGETRRINVSSEGTESNGWSWLAYISSDGFCAVFHSDASNLVPGDTNGLRDTFLHDRRSGETTRVSVVSADEQSNGASQWPSISADCRYVAFESNATNLVEGDTNGSVDTFVYDRATMTTTRVSVSSQGVEGDADSRYPYLSGDGRYVTFYSDASNLVPEDTNGATDVFVHDRLTGETSRVSVSQNGSEGNGASSFPILLADGSGVVFQSDASNLIPEDQNGQTDIFIRELPVHELYFAQFADGEGLLFSQIMLVNRTPTGTAEALLRLRNDDGLPLSVDLDGDIWAGEGEVLLPAAGSRFLRTDGSGPLSVGSVTVKSYEPLDGVILFGGAEGLAGVGASPVLAKGFLAPVEVTRALGIFFVNTGLAVMNLRATGVKLTVHLRDHTSQEVATAEESVAGYGHLAQFVHEFGWSQDIDFDEFQGTLEVRVDGAIAATVLQTRPGQFATMPVIPLMLP